MERELDCVFLNRLIGDNQHILISDAMRVGLNEKDSVDCAIEDDLKEADVKKEVIEDT